MKEKKQKERHIGIRVDEELFQEFSVYLSKNSLNKRAFFVECINKALEEDKEKSKK